MGELRCKQILHRSPLMRARRPLSKAHHGKPHRRMADQRNDVQRRAAIMQRPSIRGKIVEHFLGSRFAEQRREVLAKQLFRSIQGGVEREAAVADNDRRHALQDFFRSHGLAQGDQVVVAMGVDEPGGQITTVSLDDYGRRRRLIRANGANAIARQPHVRHEPGGACAIDHPHVADENTLWRRHLLLHRNSISRRPAAPRRPNDRPPRTWRVALRRKRPFLRPAATTALLLQLKPARYGSATAGGKIA